MFFPTMYRVAAFGLMMTCFSTSAFANETTTVPGEVANPGLISACSLVIDHEAASVTPMITLAPPALGGQTIVRFLFRTAGNQTVAMHDVQVPSPPVMGARPALKPFPFPAVAAHTSVRCDVTPQMAETIVDD